MSNVSHTTNYGNGAQPLSQPTNGYRAAGRALCFGASGLLLGVLGAAIPALLVRTFPGFNSVSLASKIAFGILGTGATVGLITGIEISVGFFSCAEKNLLHKLVRNKILKQGATPAPRGFGTV